MNKRTVSRTLTIGSLITVGALALAGCSSSQNASTSADYMRNANAKQVTLVITANAIAGGKNDAEASWIQNWVIPRFTKAEKAKGVDITVNFQPNGVDDQQYLTKISLAMRSGTGADITAVDGIWVGELADAGSIKPLDDVVGKATVDTWSGWSEIKKSVQQITTYDGQSYGIPDGTDGRVLFYNKKLFEQAGISVPWQPTSWHDIIAAGNKLKALSGVTPLQINAGTAMGEATTMQGVLPLLAGTGTELFNSQTNKWLGGGSGLEAVLNFYSKIYGSDKLGNPVLQQETSGRQNSFNEFADGKIGILMESDYLWRSVLNPQTGIAPMADRNSAVGWALIPAEKPGSGLGGKDFVSLSGGSGWVISPKTKYPQQAWDLLTFMSSKDALLARLKAQPQISARDDVNKELLSSDPLLTFIADKVLPVTMYRPSEAAYTQVSTALQEATAAIVSGQSVSQAMQTYRSALVAAVGSSHVEN